ncbi:hypothetical protein N5P37_007724 [Trichoderma harzianum]|nr:hypothetical protein N5P37_007724 [Trichoderma harzianum]
MSLLFFSFILSFHPRLCLLHYKTKWLEGCAFQRSLRVAIVANGIALSSARSCPRTPWPANSASMSPLHFAGEHQQIARRDATIHQRLVQSRGPSSTCTWTNHLCGHLLNPGRARRHVNSYPRFPVLDSWRASKPISTSHFFAAKVLVRAPAGTWTCTRTAGTALARGLVALKWTDAALYPFNRRSSLGLYLYLYLHPYLLVPCSLGACATARLGSGSVSRQFAWAGLNRLLPSSV